MRIRHRIIENGVFSQCIYCGKYFSELFIELMDQKLSDVYWRKENKESELMDQFELVEKYHDGCLTEDEMMIKDIIE
jgi:hypothetical protein